MQKVRAAKLKVGDSVAVVAPSGRPARPSELKRCLRLVEEMGFKPVLGKNALAIAGHMAGSDEARLADLNEAIKSDHIRGILCLTGGSGAIHLIDKLDYGELRKDPKVLVGGDENGCINLACYARTGLVSFIGPNLDEIQSKDSYDRLRLALTSGTPLPKIRVANQTELQLAMPAIYAPVAGTAHGPLLGGNLTALSLLMGTEFFPDLAGAILFIDDKNERTDILERWLTNFWAGGQLEKLSGAALGQFIDCDAKTSPNLLSVEEQLGERFEELKLVSCFNFPIASGKNALCVPLGSQSVLDSNQGTLSFSEAGLI